MTTVACWLNREQQEPMIWAVSDTRISKNGKTVLLDSAPKIFPLLIQCKTANSLGLFDKVAYSKELGIAYSGSSLVGLNTYITLNSLLKSLVCINEPNISIERVAHFAGKLLQRITIEVGQIETDGSLCELAIFGFCDITSDFKIFYLHPNTNPRDLQIEVVEQDIANDNNILLLGNCKDKIAELIEADRKKYNKNINWWRSPFNVIKNQVTQNSLPGIGGGINLKILTKVDFKPYCLVNPLDNDQPVASSIYQNIDISRELGNLGNCCIGMFGMI